MSTNNDEETLENIQLQLKEIEAALTLPQSKEHFKETVRKLGALKALEQMQGSMSTL